MKLDHKALILAAQSFDWNCAEDHIIQKGMKDKLKWRDHSKIAELVIEVKAEAHFYDLSELLDKVKDTEDQLSWLQDRTTKTIADIEAADTAHGLLTDRETKT